MNAFMHLVDSIKKSSNNESFIFQASDVFYMNDPQEFIYGQRVLFDTIKKTEENRRIPVKERLSEDLKKLQQKHNGNSFKYISSIIHDNYNTPFVISLSQNKDSLPMWLNYGANGNGVCLGFQKSKIKEQKESPGSKTFTFQSTMDWKSVRYHNSDVKDNTESNEIIYKMIDNYYDQLYASKIQGSRNLDNLKVNAIFDLLVEVCPYIKRNDYEYEQEVRIVRKSRVVGEDYLRKLQFRINGKGNVIPYINVEIPKEYLKLVKIGPLANYELTSSALKMIKEKYDLDYDLCQSCVKYRNY